MCGITGFLGGMAALNEPADVVVRRMADAIAHRGPDDAGVWVDVARSVALGHRRLAVLDLSPAGRQPMMSASGRYVIVFNGEIYNHLELRKQLGSVVWRGHSDTETLLATIEHWGLEEALRKSVGMFALALWDRKDRVLSLARDRMGEKPMYYGWQGGTFLFGSELKALRVHPEFRSQICREVLPLYLQYGYIPCPWSIWTDIHKLVPGTILKVSQEQPGKSPALIRYWSLTQAISAGQANPFVGSDTEAISAMESQLSESVAGQMVADVKLGAFLSGGIDSSTIVALMQARANHPVQTFTIGFKDADFNEAEYAKAVAKHLGTDHTELYVTPEEARSVIPDLPRIYDEPFGDSSQIPTFLVSKLARRGTLVVLNGDGGDELFAGYTRYSHIERWYRRVNLLPKVMRSGAANILSILFSRSKRIGKLGKLQSILAAQPLECIYECFISHTNAILTTDSKELQSYYDRPESWPFVENYLSWMMSADSLTYLPDDILVKVDRAAMAESLETRAPFLDHRVIELSWRMPTHMKSRNGQTKFLLRQVLGRYLPNNLIERKKMGFAVPVHEWLKGPLREWAETLLNEENLKSDGFLNVSLVRRMWAEHVSGNRNWSASLWDILMLQAWLETER